MAASSSAINEKLAELYELQGIDVTKQAGTEQKTEPGSKKQADEVTVFTRTVAGKTFTGRDEAEVLNQVAAHAEAITQSPTVQKVEPPPVPKTLSKDELFNIGLKIQQGNAEGIDEYLEKSDYLGRVLAKHGVTLAQLKGTVQATDNTAQREAAQTAATAWLQREGNDWPGGKGNMKILGFTLASMGLKPSDIESYEKAYQHMKAEGMVLPSPETQKTEKRTAKGSTSFGAGADNSTRQTAKQNIPTISRAAWDKMTQMEQRQTYEDLVGQGFKPEDIKFVA